MKKLLTITAAILCASALVVSAQETNKPAKKAKKELTAEQQAVVNDMLAKYDTNKDGKLDKTEKAAMTKEDKEKYAKAMGMGKKKTDAGAATDAPKGDK